MNKVEYNENDKRIALLAKAMGHPARISILRFLASQSSCYFGELHEVLPITKATVSRHLSELKEVGLIQGSFEPPKVRYCINREKWEYANKIFKEFYSSYNIDQITNCSKE